MSKVNHAHIVDTLNKSTTDALLEIFDVEQEIADAERLPLPGALSMVPIIIKDNILYKGHQASAGSRILEGYRATYSSTVVERLKAAGALIVGRANMDEFAMGSSTETSAFKKTTNPFDARRVPGGSSGGSAAIVAEGIVPVSFGTDTGGSVRQPAAFCGVVGFKPTYGAISRFGLIAMGSSLDQAGIFARTVREAHEAFDVVRGKDERDATTLDIHEVSSDVQTIGVPWKLIEQEGVDSDVIESFKASITKLEQAGYSIKDVSIDHIESSLAVYYVVMPAEVSSNLARYDGVRYGYQSQDASGLAEMYKKSRGEGFGDEVRRRIILGTYVLSAGYADALYKKAEGLRNVIRRSFNTVFEDVDIIATPTTPTPAFTFGEHADNPLKMYMADIFTVPASITGLPALSVPSGFVEREGVSLPLGIQFVAPHKEDKRLFTLGESFEKIRE